MPVSLKDDGSDDGSGIMAFVRSVGVMQATGPPSRAVINDANPIEP